jgi:hypothetical protein
LSQLTAAQLDALRSLRAAYPDAEIAIIGATALAFHIDMAWRTSVDLDLVIAVSAADLGPSRLPGWRRHPKLEHSWKTSQGVLVDLVPAPSDALDAGEIVWPESGHHMNLTGIRQGLQSTKVPHILDEYPSLDDDGLFSDAVRAMRLELGPARAFVLGLRLREIVDERDREVVDAFLRTIEEDVHWTRFVETVLGVTTGMIFEGRSTHCDQASKQTAAPIDLPWV